VVLHIKYTSRDGGPELRRLAQESVQTHLPNNGIRLFDIRHDFAEQFTNFSKPIEHARGRKKHKEHHIDLSLHFTRMSFSFLIGRRVVKITQIDVFIEPDEQVSIGKHIKVGFIHGDQNKEFTCIVTSKWPHLYHGVFEADLGPITDAGRTVGKLRFPQSCHLANQVYLMCHYTAKEIDSCACKNRAACCCGATESIHARYVMY